MIFYSMLKSWVVIEIKVGCDRFDFTKGNNQVIYAKHRKTEEYSSRAWKMILQLWKIDIWQQHYVFFLSGWETDFTRNATVAGIMQFRSKSHQPCHLTKESLKETYPRTCRINNILNAIKTLRMQGAARVQKCRSHFLRL